MAFSFGPSDTQATDYFFHCPRTGGNYTIRVINALRLQGEPIFRKHRGRAHGALIDLTAGTGGVRRSFTILRPPLDWYRSFYRFRITKHYVGRNMEPGHPLDKFIWEGTYQNGGHIFSFDHFVKEVQLEYPEGYLTALYGRFMRGVDVVLSTDEIGTQLPALLAKWGYDAPVWTPEGKKNKTVDRHGNWAPPKRFAKWVLRVQEVDGQIKDLPVDLRPGTLDLMTAIEAGIITKLGGMGI